MYFIQIRFLFKPKCTIFNSRYFLERMQLQIITLQLHSNFIIEHFLFIFVPAFYWNVIDINTAKSMDKRGSQTSIGKQWNIKIYSTAS